MQLIFIVLVASCVAAVSIIYSKFFYDGPVPQYTYTFPAPSPPAETATRDAPVQPQFTVNPKFRITFNDDSVIGENSAEMNSTRETNWKKLEPLDYTEEESHTETTVYEKSNDLYTSTSGNLVKHEEFTTIKTDMVEPNGNWIASTTTTKQYEIFSHVSHTTTEKVETDEQTDDVFSDTLSEQDETHDLIHDSYSTTQQYDEDSQMFDSTESEFVDDYYR